MKNINIVNDHFGKNTSQCKTEIAGLEQPILNHDADSLFEGSNDGMILVEKDLLVLDVNKAFIDLTGISKEAIVGKSSVFLAKTLIKPKQLPQILNILKSTILGKPTKRFELYWNDKVLEISSLVLQGGRYVGIISDITNLTNANKELQLIENKFSRIANVIPDIIYQVDAQTQEFSYLSPLFEQLLGYSVSDIKEMGGRATFLSKKIQDDGFAKQEQNFHQLKGTFKESQEPNCTESWWKCKDGTLLYIEDRWIPVFVGGKMTSTDGILRDITERKKKEETIQASEAKYRTLFTSANDAIFLMQNFTFISCNNKTLEIFGCTEDEIIGHTPKEFSPVYQPDGRLSSEKALEKMNAALAGSLQFFEWVHVKKNGLQFYAEVSLSKIVLFDGLYILAIVRDISERKQSEEQITLLAQALQSIDECVSITDINDQILYVNEAFLHTYGYAEDELIGKSINMVRSPNNPIELTQEILPATIRGGWKGEILNRRKDGSDFPISLHTSVVRDENGQMIALIGIANDITRQKQIETDLTAALKRAQESDRLKSAFLANMSHEIRTPMNGILGFSELLKETGLSGEEQKNYISIIEKSGERMLNTINDLIEISKLEAGSFNVSFSEVTIAEVLTYFLNFFKLEAENKGLEFSLCDELLESKLVIKTDKEKLLGILTNLLKNAIKYTDKGSVEFGYQKKDDFVEFFVKDTGIGISKEQQQVIFERFVQVKMTKARTYEGSGLGLAITKANVELLGGTIRVESEKGKGSRFYFTLPI